MPGWCGAAAIQNALLCLGIRAKQSTIAKHAGCTVKDGTTQHGMKQALERLDVDFEEINERKYSDAEDLAVAHLAKGPLIVLTEFGEHWEVIAGLAGSNRVIVIDSQNYKFNTTENGIHILKLGKQLRSYWTPYEGSRYAITVSEPKK